MLLSPEKILATPNVLRGFDIQGNEIVISLSNGEKALWIVTQDTPERLCRGFSPQFFDDKILYIDAESGDRTDICLYERNIAACSHLTKKGRNLAPQPSPDKNLVAFLSDRGGPLSLYTVNLRTRKNTCILTPESPLSMRPFVWSPDGGHIVYWARKSVNHSEISVFTLQTGESEQLIYFPTSLTRVGSPYIWYLSTSASTSTSSSAFPAKSNVWIDEERFIFLSDATGHDSFGISTLFGEVEWIKHSSTWDKEFYQVSPDGEWICCNEYVDGTSCVAFYSIEEPTRKTVKIDGCLSSPIWSKNGVYCWESSTTKGTGIVCIPLEGEPQDCYFEPPPLPTFPSIPIKYKTFDNREIGAWLYNPEAKKILVWLHGGPADVFLNNFDPAIQYFALRGYCVFAPNFRGSTGYGREFRTLNQNDLGGGDLRDVIEGISYLRDQGYKTFVAGGQSYGAYLAAMVVVKHPEICEGAFCLSGIYNLFPDYASEWLINSGCVWMNLEDHALLTDRSPVYHLENLTKPVFIIHGSKDQYTPLSSVEQMLREARKIEKDHLVRAIIYEGGHGLSRRGHIQKVYPAIAEFMDKITR